MDRLPKGFQHVQESLVRRKAINKPRFEVDEKGLAKLLERRGKGYAALEIVSNALDEAATHVDIVLKPVEGERRALFQVADDNPDGFKDLSHAYTLFAPSLKGPDATRRGRFNFGEKLAIALCDEAFIATTTGRVDFNESGRHMHPRTTRIAGSLFSGYMKLSRAEITETLRLIRQVILPLNVTVTLNDEVLGRPKILRSFDVTLPTEFTDEQGILRRSRRATTVHVYEVRAGEKATLFELGIPVVETGDEWHYDVRQRVPLNMERDNVTPSYLQDLRTHVVNAMMDNLTEDNAGESWVKNALEDPNITPEAVNIVLDKTVGERRVVHTPNDPEASKLAIDAGYTVVYPRSFNPKQWYNIKRAEAIPPAGQVTPSGERMMRNEGSKEAERAMSIAMAIGMVDAWLEGNLTEKEGEMFAKAHERWRRVLEGK